VFAVVYYVVFRWVITKWNLRTPGREDEPLDSEQTGVDAPTERVRPQPHRA